ncbi:hypothetical protein SKAU_G00143220 [Synaphobranchus kaupii]|uniref:Uncharacterized protein n=1 Tax=Synaphobranchus kaupii TaxID=118154 RepID=A0A9Q1FTB1_SYNKA|nr:hypothetical protein SKAU_G00143220 [Synaphobranchus kaupii]
MPRPASQAYHCAVVPGRTPAVSPWSGATPPGELAVMFSVTPHTSPPTVRHRNAGTEFENFERAKARREGRRVRRNVDAFATVADAKTVVSISFE